MHVFIFPQALIARVLKVADGTARAKETMRTLTAKCPDGYEGWAREKGEEPVERVIPYTSGVPKI